MTVDALATMTGAAVSGVGSSFTHWQLVSEPLGKCCSEGGRTSVPDTVCRVVQSGWAQVGGTHSSNSIMGHHNYRLLLMLLLELCCCSCCLPRGVAKFERYCAEHGVDGIDFDVLSRLYEDPNNLEALPTDNLKLLARSMIQETMDER